MYGNIVVAADGSAHAARAVDLAARLVIVHVVEAGTLDDDMRHLAEAEHLSATRPGSDLMLSGVPEWMHEAVRVVQNTGEDQQVLDRLGEMVLERAVAAARRAGAERVEQVLEHGAPARAITKVVRREKADLLVMGSRGLSDLKGLVFGSVSHRLAHLAPCTCITVSDPAGDAHGVR